MKTSEKTLTEERQTLGALLRLPYQAMQDRVYSQLAYSGFPEIRPAHSVVFRYILPGGSRSIDLAERAHITKQSMGYLIDYLVEHGYVEVGPDPDDGRAKRVRLTPKGLECQQTALRLSQEVEAELAARIGQDEFAELRRLLLALNDAVISVEAP